MKKLIAKILQPFADLMIEALEITLDSPTFERLLSIATSFDAYLTVFLDIKLN